MKTDQGDNSFDTQQLLKRAGAGSEEAFEQLFQHYRGYLHQVVAMRLDPHMCHRVDASDIIQEAQMVAIRRLQDYLQRKPVSFRVWLRQIAHDQLLMAYRKHVQAKRRTVNREIRLPEQSSIQLASLLLDNGPTPSQQAARDEQVRCIRLALGRLPDDDRDIILMRNHEQLSFEEIGYVLHIESATARKRYGRALIRLGKITCEMGLTESQI
ncbi:MAG: RNA polymerase sigma factor [Planctomycetota bacterium]|jgi:RNA polymerase sigma-70 factor (ECF subfamily)